MKLKTLALSIVCAAQLISTNSIAEVTKLQYNSETYYVTEVSGSYLQLQDRLQNNVWYKLVNSDNFANETLTFNLLREYGDVDVYGLFESYDFDGEDGIMRVFADPTSLPDIVIDSYGTSRSSVNLNTVLSWLVSVPSAADTLTSMQPNASAMKNAFNRQYSQLAYGLNHDCTIFDANNICVSVFGRQTNMSDSSYDSSAAGLVLAYKPHAQFRMGAYIDQTMSNDTTAGVELERSNPDFGVFGVWNQQADGSGLQLRAAANYGKRDINVSRMVVGDSSAEAGRGKSDLNAYGALFEASYAFALNDMWSAKPYAGVRYLSIKRDGYTEASTDNVYNPLSYSTLEQETTSAIAGIRLNGQLTPKVIASMNVGIEHDLDHSIDDYRATGVNDLGRIDMDSQEDKTRPTAGLGLSYDVAEKQRISAAVQYRKEIFMSESSTTGQITYTIGF